MGRPSTRTEFIDYCKRQLGAPVLEINVADEQIEDIVDDAIQYFQERHFDGVAQTYLKYKVTQDDIDDWGANWTVGFSGYFDGNPKLLHEVGKSIEVVYYNKDWLNEYGNQLISNYRFEYKNVNFYEIAKAKRN